MGEKKEDILKREALRSISTLLDEHVKPESKTYALNCLRRLEWWLADIGIDFKIPNGEVVFS